MDLKSNGDDSMTRPPDHLNVLSMQSHVGARQVQHMGGNTSYDAS